MSSYADYTDLAIRTNVRMDATHHYGPPLYKRVVRGGGGHARKSRKSGGPHRSRQSGEWLDSIPESMKLPDLETLEALSRGEPVGPATQQRLWNEESELENIRRRKVKADATTKGN